MERFGVLIEQAKAKGVHVTLGFASWVDYIADVISAAMPARLAVDERRRMVELLTSEGMSGAAQADALGVDKSTVSRDIAHNQVLHDATPDAGTDAQDDDRPQGQDPAQGVGAKSKAAKARKRVADPKPKPKPATPTGEDRRAYLLEELRALREFLSAVAVSGPSTRAIVAQYSAVLTEVAEIVAASDPTR